MMSYVPHHTVSNQNICMTSYQMNITVHCIISCQIISYRITNRVVSYHMTWRYIAACRILMALYHLISYDRRNFGLWKSNFQQYGQMEKQRWDESEKRREVKWSEEKRREEERRSEKRKSQRKEDAGARKGSKVAKHCVFPMVCGSGGSTSRVAKAAGAEPWGQMRDEKLHAVVAQSTCRSQNV